MFFPLGFSFLRFLPFHMWTVNRLTDGILLYKLFQIHYSSMPMSVVYSIKKPQIRLKVRKVGISAKHLDTIHPQRLYPQCTGWCWGTSHLEASSHDVCQQEVGDLQSKGWGGKRGHFCGPPNLLLPTSTLVNVHLIGLVAAGLVLGTSGALHVGGAWSP